MLNLIGEKVMGSNQEDYPFIPLTIGVKGATVVPNDSIQNKLSEIMRHILEHDSFHSISYEIIHDEYSGHYLEIYCHCEKTWHITHLDIVRSRIEVEEIVKVINRLNSPSFFDRLKCIKEKEKEVTMVKNKLLVKTESPTISCLEI